MNSNLVYAIHTVEARDWGPHMACNIDPRHPNGSFKCASGRVPIPVHDAKICNTCDRTATHAGWYPMSQLASRYTRISAECKAAAEKTCNNTGTPVTHGMCLACLRENEHLWPKYNCTMSELVSTSFCPDYIKPSAACDRLAITLCGSKERRIENSTECKACVANHSAQLFAAGCPNPNANPNPNPNTNLYPKPDPNICYYRLPAGRKAAARLSLPVMRA